MISDYMEDIARFGYENVNEALYCGFCGAAGADTHERGCPSGGKDPVEALNRLRIDGQCYECHYVNGHNEGACSRWVDMGDGYDDEDWGEKSLEKYVNEDIESRYPEPDEELPF
jgi:hypothetical protein